MTLTDEEKRVMLHALGLNHGAKIAHRNYYTLPVDVMSKSRDAWDTLAFRGLATQSGKRDDGATIMYRVTLAGCRALGSRMCERITLDLIPEDKADDKP